MAPGKHFFQVVISSYGSVMSGVDIIIYWWFVYTIISLLIQFLLCFSSFYYVNQLRDKSLKAGRGGF